jgi:hypothetical protein
VASFLASPATGCAVTGGFRLSRLSAMFTESKKKIQGKDAIPGKILPEKHNR